MMYAAPDRAEAAEIIREPGARDAGAGRRRGDARVRRDGDPAGREAGRTGGAGGREPAEGKDIPGQAGTFEDFQLIRVP